MSVARRAQVIQNVSGVIQEYLPKGTEIPWGMKYLWVIMTS